MSTFPCTHRPPRAGCGPCATLAPRVPAAGSLPSARAPRDSTDTARGFIFPLSPFHRPLPADLVVLLVKWGCARFHWIMGSMFPEHPAPCLPGGSPASVQHCRVLCPPVGAQSALSPPQNDQDEEGHLPAMDGCCQAVSFAGQIPG